MRPNKTKAKLKAGQVALGSIVSLPNPMIVEMLGAIGYDFAFIDMEHTAITEETCENMLRAADVYGVTPLVRIPHDIPGMFPNELQRVLDAGAMGVIIPHVTSRKEAEAIVDAVKFPPMGHRGASGGRPAGWGASGSQAEYMKTANAETMITIMIEDKEGLDNLEEIVQVEGIDVVHTGLGDLTASLGVPGQNTHPLVKEAVARILSVSRAAGKAVGRGAYNVDGIDAYADLVRQGFTSIYTSVDAMLLRSARAFLQDMEQAKSRSVA